MKFSSLFVFLCLVLFQSCDLFESRGLNLNFKTNDDKTNPTTSGAVLEIDGSYPSQFLGDLDIDSSFSDIKLYIDYSGNYYDLACEVGEELNQLSSEMTLNCECRGSSISVDKGCYISFATTNNELSFQFPLTIKEIHVDEPLVLEYEVSLNTVNNFNLGDLPGCIDPDADNYNPQATYDDGSCEYPPEVIYGCTDSTANNWDGSATVDDGSCTYDTLGCTDPNAKNYNEEATFDDESCEYTQCSDPFALIYFEDANSNLECTYKTEYQDKYRGYVAYNESWQAEFVTVNNESPENIDMRPIEGATRIFELTVKSDCASATEYSLYTNNPDPTLWQSQYQSNTGAFSTFTVGLNPTDILSEPYIGCFVYQNTQYCTGNWDVQYHTECN